MSTAKQIASARIHLTQQEIDAFLGPVLRAHPDWTAEDAWRVAFVNGVNDMARIYRQWEEHDAQRQETTP